MIELIDFMMQHYLQEVILNMHFGLLLTGKLIIVGIILKLNLAIKELDYFTYPVYVKIYLLYLLFIHILKRMNHLLRTIYLSIVL